MDAPLTAPKTGRAATPAPLMPRASCERTARVDAPDGLDAPVRPAALVPSAATGRDVENACAPSPTAKPVAPAAVPAICRPASPSPLPPPSSPPLSPVPSALNSQPASGSVTPPSAPVLSTAAAATSSPAPAVAPGKPDSSVITVSPPNPRDSDDLSAAPSKGNAATELRASQTDTKVRVGVKSPSCAANASTGNTSEATKKPAIEDTTSEPAKGKADSPGVDPAPKSTLSDSAIILEADKDSTSPAAPCAKSDPARKRAGKGDRDVDSSLGGQVSPGSGSESDHKSERGERASSPCSRSMAAPVSAPTSSAPPSSSNTHPVRRRKRPVSTAEPTPDPNQQLNTRRSLSIVSSPTKRRRTGAWTSSRDVNGASGLPSKPDADGNNASEAGSTKNNDDNIVGERRDENVKPDDKSNSDGLVTVKKEDAKDDKERKAVDSDSVDDGQAQKSAGSRTQVRSKKRRRGTKRRLESRVDSRRRATVTDDTAAPVVVNEDDAKNDDANRKGENAEIEIDWEALTYYPPPGASDPNAKHVDRPSGSGDDESDRDGGKATDTVKVEMATGEGVDNRESSVDETPVRTRGSERLLRSRKRSRSKVEDEVEEESSGPRSGEGHAETQRAEMTAGVSTRGSKRRRAAPVQVPRHNKRTRSMASASGSASGSSHSPNVVAHENAHAASSSSPAFEEVAVVATSSRKSSGNANPPAAASNAHDGSASVN